ncbi:WD40-repeat-containing domain protein [Apiosordaria backusii]|uniref:WD40-repeat-containing domain protein n=1 Tax=Apiosordaria backusii TaxID=314023 RepID=A0AA40ASJ0_9PEZI|nr:WD40-repeat-containing domain protein [Apiosordaria backusii]
MADFNEYPPDLPVRDALILRNHSASESAHAVVPYSASDLARPSLGPANPFKGGDEPTTGDKRKNVLTGRAEETFISEHTFRAKHRAVERDGGPEREFLTSKAQKELAKRVRETREGKGSATVADGEGSYVGPWARYKTQRWEEVEVEVEVEEGRELGSDEEFVTDDGEEEVVESGTVIKAPEVNIKRREEVERQGEETSVFEGSEEFDYLGRGYLHVPQDLDFSLQKEVGEVTNFIPKKTVHVWRPHGKAGAAVAVTSLRLFPKSSHLGLSGGADGLVKIWDVYRGREVLRRWWWWGGRRFLSGGFDRKVRLWDTETGQCVQRFNVGKTPHVVKFNPGAENGHEFLAGLSDNRIVQYDSRAGNETVQEYDHHLGAINTLEFIDDSRRFMSTSDDRSLRVWEYGIPVEIKTISEPDMFALTKSAQHPSGKYVLYQCSDNSIVAYSSGSDKFRQNRKKAWRGHNTAGSAIGLTCSPDGQFVASGDTGGSVCFWDFKTCKLYSKLTADSSGGAINCVAWSEQETSKVFTAGAKGEIRLWD